MPPKDKRGVPNYMGGRMTYGLIRHLCEQTGGPYLEIGSYRGASLLAAGDGTGVKCTGIDNFSGVSIRLAEDHESALHNNIEGRGNIQVINKEFRAALRGIKKKFTVIFLDGPHDYSGTTAQLAATKNLKKGGFVIIDDANSKEIQAAANAYFAANEGFEKVFEKYTTPDRGKAYSTDPDWWNGIQVWERE